MSLSFFVFCGKHSEDELREIFLRVNDNDDCSAFSENDRCGMRDGTTTSSR
jgi:hypothetical protein